MSKTSTDKQAHPDELLPWFVNGTLSSSERNDVAQHVQACSKCQQEIALLQRMRTHIKETPSQSPGEFGLNRLLSEIRKEQVVTKMEQPRSSGWWRTGLAIAASLIIFIQARFLLDAWYLSKPMAPLAGPQTHEQVLQISFQPTATEAQIREALSHIHGTFIDGPSSLGLYRVRLNTAASPETPIQQTIEQLRQQTTIIQHVAED